MYPYKIIWDTEDLKEIHEDESYGYVEDLSGIKKIIYKYVDEYINEYEDYLKYKMKNNDDDIPLINIFYEMVNSEPYCDYIFLSVKYFDFALKSWKNYEVDEKELDDYLVSYLKK